LQLQQKRPTLVDRLRRLWLAVDVFDLRQNYSRYLKTYLKKLENADETRQFNCHTLICNC
jgi:hypothetical protein